MVSVKRYAILDQCDLISGVTQKAVLAGWAWPSPFWPSSARLFWVGVPESVVGSRGKLASVGMVQSVVSIQGRLAWMALS